MIDLIFPGIMLCLMGAVIWYMRCIQFTVRDFDALNNASFSSRRFAQLYGRMPITEKLDAHAWRYFVFRDPWVLYPPELVEAAKAKKLPYWETETDPSDGPILH